jgi:hypothetical protein
MAPCALRREHLEEMRLGLGARATLSAARFHVTGERSQCPERWPTEEAGALAFAPTVQQTTKRALSGRKERKSFPGNALLHQRCRRTGARYSYSVAPGTVSNSTLRVELGQEASQFVVAFRGATFHPGSDDGMQGGHRVVDEARRGAGKGPALGQTNSRGWRRC